jgi:hypothetical protein
MRPRDAAPGTHPPASPRLVALPDREDRVRCGRPSCGRTLPGVLRLPDPPTAQVRHLFLAIGWSTQDDRPAWVLSTKARRDRRFMRGDRHYPVTYDHLAPGEPPPDGAVDRREVVVGAFVPAALDDVAIVCPYCGAPQRLDAGRLGIAPWPGGAFAYRRARIGTHDV